MVIAVNQGEEKNLWKEQMKTHSKNKQTAISVRRREGVANAFDFVHCTWLVESVARAFLIQSMWRKKNQSKDGLRLKRFSIEGR